MTPEPSRPLPRMLAGQAGFLLPMVLIVLSVGSVIIIAMLSLTSTISRSAGQNSDLVLDRFTAEAGMTDVLADLMRGYNLLTSTYATPTTAVNSKAVSFTIETPPTTTEPISIYQYIDPGAGFGLLTVPAGTSTFFRIDNVKAGTHIRVNWAFTPSNQWWKVRVYRDYGPTTSFQPVPIASDTFESGNFAGGTGWLANWVNSGDAVIINDGGAHGGSYHARLRAGSGILTRSVNLSTSTNVRLRFWAKANDFEPGETATCSVSPDGVGYTVIRTWRDGEDDSVYRYEDISLKAFEPYSSDFRIRCRANMSGTADIFWFDDLEVVSQEYPAPYVQFSDTLGPGGIFVDSSLVTGGMYTIEFFNNSGVSLVSNAYATTGSASNTWIYAQAFKDYLVSATAENSSSTVAAYIRAIPGSTSPTTQQRVYIYSWREP